MYRIELIEEFAIPREEGLVIASLVSLPGEFSIGSIRGGFPIGETGRRLHPEEITEAWIAQGRLQQEVLEGGGASPSAIRREAVVHSREYVPRLSWVRGHILSPFDPLKPIFVNGGQPGIGLMTDNPGIEKIEKVGISLIDRKTRLGFEQGL